MRYAQGNERRLVFTEHEFLVATRDKRSATDYNPMLRAVMMQMQRQTTARMNDDPLDLNLLGVERTPATGRAQRRRVRLRLDPLVAMASSTSGRT